MFGNEPEFGSGGALVLLLLYILPTLFLFLCVLAVFARERGCEIRTSSSSSRSGGMFTYYCSVLVTCRHIVFFSDS